MSTQDTTLPPLDSRYQPDGAIKMALQWLQVALDCKSFQWDADQHEFALLSLEHAHAEWAAIAAQAQQPATVKDSLTPQQAQQAQGVPADFRTHRDAWRQALILARDSAEVSAPDIDDRAYWEHEIAAFDRAYSELAAAPQAEPQPEREPLSREQKRAMWVAATIELCSHENCYLRGIFDAEQAHGIGTKGGDK